MSMTRAIAPAPCNNCPFRKDVPIYLRGDRRHEIADTLRRGADFACHKTVEHDDETGEPTHHGVTCAGAAKALMADGGTTQLMRVAERLGVADLDRTEATGADVWPLSEWTRLAEGATGDDPEWDEPEHVETCNTVDRDCEAPAGYMSPSGAVEYGDIEATERCRQCDEPVCSACITADGLCGHCRDEGWDNE